MAAVLASTSTAASLRYVGSLLVPYVVPTTMCQQMVNRSMLKRCYTSRSSLGVPNDIEEHVVDAANDVDNVDDDANNGTSINEAAFESGMLDLDELSDEWKTALNDAYEEVTNQKEKHEIRFMGMARNKVKPRHYIGPGETDIWRYIRVARESVEDAEDSIGTEWISSDLSNAHGATGRAIAIVRRVFERNNLPSKSTESVKVQKNMNHIAKTITKLRQRLEQAEHDNHMKQKNQEKSKLREKSKQRTMR